MLLPLLFSASCVVAQDFFVSKAVYEVSDLLDRTSPLRETPETDGLNARGAGAAARASRAWGGDAQIANQRELSRLIRAFCHPPFGEGNRIDCMVDGGKAGPLVVTAGAEQQAFVRDFLAWQRESQDKTQIAFHLVTGKKDSFAALGIPTNGIYGTPAERESILARLTQGDFDVLSSPTVVTHVLQRADVSIVNQFSYVKEFHVQIDQASGSLIADPVIEVINEGILCSVRSVALPGGDYGLTLDVESVEVLRPVRTKSVRIAAGSDSEGEIQLPDVLRARLSGDVRLADGATAVFVTPLKEDQDLALFVSIELDPPGGR